MAPLLPKLRGHFAEFLHHNYLELLSILYLTTCVGLGYGQLATSRRCFSRQHRINDFPIRVPIASHPYMRDGFAYPAGYMLSPGQPSPGITYLPASHLTLTTPVRVRSRHPTSPEGSMKLWFA